MTMARAKHRAVARRRREHIAIAQVHVPVIRATQGKAQCVSVGYSWRGSSAVSQNAPQHAPAGRAGCTTPGRRVTTQPWCDVLRRGRSRARRGFVSDTGGGHNDEKTATEEQAMAAIPARPTSIPQKPTSGSSLWSRCSNATAFRGRISSSRQLIDKRAPSGAHLPYSANTAYLNTIPESREEHTPATRRIEWRIRSLIRWNALAMVVQANRVPASSAGTSRASPPPRRSTTSASTTSGSAQRQTTAATWSSCKVTRRPASTPAPSWRAGSSEDDLLRFRQEADGAGLSSYPHPVADAGLLAVPHGVDGARPHHGHLPGPLHALPAQPRHRAIPSGRKVWAFMGDGEMDEPEAMGAIDAAVTRAPGQPRVRHQLQPAAARRPGARQRQDHPGAGRRLPRRGLERHQGDLGLVLGSAAACATPRACCESAWRRRSTASTRLQGQGRRLHPRALLRQVPRAEEDGVEPVATRTSGGSTAAVTTRTRSTPPTPRR